MLNRLKAAASFAGEMMEAHYDRQRKVDAMSNELARRTDVTDSVQLRKIAETLVDHADITWK